MPHATRPHTTQLKGLYAITDSQLLPHDELIPAVEAALSGGLCLLQYRDKSATDHTRLRRARDLVACCRNFSTPLIINDDAALARRVGAAGVHLGQADGDLRAARQLLGPDAIIGVTCHGRLDLAIRAAQVPVDYLAFGRFFDSRTKTEAPLAPLQILADAAFLQLPRVAIGGITLDNAAQALAAGAEMLALVHALFAAPDIRARCIDFNRLIAAAYP